MMLLKALHSAGLTNLSRDEVDQYEAAVRSGQPIEEKREIKFWGWTSILLCALLAISAIPILRGVYVLSDTQGKAYDIDKIATLEHYELTRGSGDEETNPSKILKRVHDRVQQINQELSTLRLHSIDYSSLGSQRKRLAALNLELSKLAEDAARAKKKLES